ncbi:hypothetical protein [Amycolatopsis eburnea]|uniref:STAS domain-containing protein n=1 Tax=Amycolatopsis eburnea TaxID=2267691 RepID=A0A3R9KHY9_9PSEU|nr:hypothetical protein [Amycolatopsis eburnea]RSD13618.1 hypothetical protein EIY87_28370 [Amycolatopsis eburnea]
MTAVQVHEPLRRLSPLVCHVQVADGAICLRITGSVSSGDDATSVVDELTEACGLCCGMVLLDVTRCDIDSELLIAMIRDAALRATSSRCQVRVLVDEPDVVTALSQAGIARAELPAGTR